MRMKDDLGDRMKLYESMEAGRRLMPLLPALARIDGRAFHSFTRGMARPFDATFSACMVDTTAALVRDTGACMGYTQSDEITLAWHSRNAHSKIWFDGRVAKMTSQLAAQATLIFYRLVLERSVCSVLDMPPLGTVTNREAVIFDGVPPMLAEGHNALVSCPRAAHGRDKPQRRSRGSAGAECYAIYRVQNCWATDRGTVGSPPRHACIR